MFLICDEKGGKHHMKKIISMLLAVSLCVAALAGCGAPASTSAGEPSSSPASTGTSGENSFAGQELNIAIFEGGYGPEYWEEIVALVDPDVMDHVTSGLSASLGSTVAVRSM